MDTRKNVLKAYIALLNVIFGEDEGSSRVYQSPDWLEMMSICNKVIRSLGNDREQEIIRLRFGLHDGKKHTFEAIGSRLNISGNFVRLILQKALRRLRHPTRSRRLRVFIVPTLEERIREFTRLEMMIKVNDDLKDRLSRFQSVASPDTLERYRTWSHDKSVFAKAVMAFESNQVIDQVARVCRQHGIVTAYQLRVALQAKKNLASVGKVRRKYLRTLLETADRLSAQ